MSYEKITIVGNIGSVDELATKAGNRYLRLSVAANRSSKDKRITTWYSVVLYGKMVENIDKLKQVFRKGRLILVEGQPKVEGYVKRDGTAGVDNSIMASALPVLLDSPAKTEPDSE